MLKEVESILEIGPGTGCSLIEIAKKISQNAQVHGVDISLGMLKKAKRKLRKRGLLRRVESCCGDALCMPYRDNVFDAVFMSFTLEPF